jgi:hypothetical protein
VKGGDIVTVATGDRIIGLPSAKLRPTPGQLDDDKLAELTRLLALWLGIG